jgi:tetratricopeptide (TPR) repeat protein
MSGAIPPNPQTLVDSVVRCIDGNDVAQGLALCQRLNRQFPDHAYGWYLASFLMRKARNLRDALRAVDRALQLDDAGKYRLHKAKCLWDSGDAAGTATIAAGLAAHAKGDARFHSELGALFVQLGRHRDALAQCGVAVAIAPDNAEFRYNEAALQRFFGDVEAAERGFEAVIELKPSEYEAYNARSHLRTQTPASNHVEELRRVIERTRDPIGLVQLHFALGKELEDLGDFDGAFASLSKGAATKRRQMQYRVATDLDIIGKIREVYDAGLFDGRVTGCAAADPIFILGMPRTGTTLVERILDSHPQVQSLGERNDFSLELIRRVRSGRLPAAASRVDFVAQTATVDFAALGAAYVESVATARDGSPRFIDKLPFNYLYAGLIHLALPHARIINLQRHPLDTCYAVYKQLFKDAYPFSYDLEELAQYYVAYHELMQHWNAVMPGVILTVRYEDVVADLETSTRALLEYCGLPWDDACLRFHENRRASTTASATQVRQPLYDSSVGKWRHVERQLQPVRAILARAGIALD